MNTEFQSPSTNASQTCDTCKYLSSDAECSKSDELDEYDKRGFDTNDFGSTVDCPCWEEKDTVAKHVKPTESVSNLINRISTLADDKKDGVPTNWVEYDTNKIAEPKPTHHAKSEKIATVDKYTDDDIMSVDYQLIDTDKRISRYITIIGYEKVNGQRMDTDIKIDATLTLPKDNIFQFEKELKELIDRHRI